MGPCGKCDTVRAVGVPLCSCKRTMSLSPPAFALSTRMGRIMLPRFRRIDVGSNKRISFAKVPSLLEGSLYTKKRTKLVGLSCTNGYADCLGNHSFVPTRCNQDSGIDNTRELRILVV